MNARKTQMEILLDRSSCATCLRSFILSLQTPDENGGQPQSIVVKIKAHACKMFNTGPGTELLMQYKKNCEKYYPRVLMSKAGLATPLVRSNEIPRGKCIHRLHSLIQRQDVYYRAKSV